MYTEVIDSSPEINKELGFFRFRQYGGNEYVLTNDIGDYISMRKEDFWDLIHGKEISDRSITEKLVSMGILGKEEFAGPDNIHRYRNKNRFLFQGTLLHIIVGTLRCNLKCSYCQASAKRGADKQFDMDEETAKKVVDTIFQSPGSRVDIEFQGGEPLVNWPIIEYIINYSNRKALAEEKDVFFSLVTNLVSITDEQIQFLVDNEVGISTSIDGPEKLHDLHRGSGSLKKTKANLEKCTTVYKEKYVLRLPGALLTATADSLDYPVEIVDMYADLGLESVHLRKVSPFGMASKSMDEFAFSDVDFLEFYEKAFDRVIEINKEGKRFTERAAYLFLVKMLTDYPVNHMDCRNPCGAGIGQVAYNYNGNVYTCDEGRMMSMMGREDFKLGNVHENTFKEMMDNDVVKAMCAASCMESLPACNLCAYKPYCGVCPLYNFAVEGSLFGMEHFNERCRINKGIMDIILKKAKDMEVMEIYRRWINDIVIV
ncbi:MAG TPA: His-Xaa-Ser system radical SAM maturase HxsB [bacterium]|nr:His-Xaa-Ser system radical SAM maturase HxsB [bacterium]